MPGFTVSSSSDGGTRIVGDADGLLEIAGLISDALRDGRAAWRDVRDVEVLVVERVEVWDPEGQS